MLDSKIYSNTKKKETNHAAARMLAEMTRKNLQKDADEALIARFSRPRSRRYIELMHKYSALLSKKGELEAQLEVLLGERGQTEEKFPAKKPSWLDEDYGEKAQTQAVEASPAKKPSWLEEDYGEKAQTQAVEASSVKKPSWLDEDYGEETQPQAVEVSSVKKTSWLDEDDGEETIEEVSWLDQNDETPSQTQAKESADWMNQEYQIKESSSEALKEELKRKLELLHAELEDIKEQVKKELPDADKYLGLLYESINEDKLRHMGVIDSPGTPIPTIEALDATTYYEDERARRQWHKGYDVADAAWGNYLTVEIYRSIVCKVMDDGSVVCYRD